MEQDFCMKYPGEAQQSRGLRELPVPATVMRPLSLTVTTWFRDRDWVSLESGLVTRGRMPLQAASTSPLLTVQSQTEAGPAPSPGVPSSHPLGTAKGCSTPYSALSNPRAGESPQSQGMSWAMESQNH